ncbi:FAD-dependent oxidoreductase [Bryocella elongata]|nr:NAD(P)/FAD-dependent oxidoreductase [Bryocella elongata]
MTHDLRIAIVGAGPGGLVLANILDRHGVTATIFESDSSATARAQGGVLDLHAEGGQYAMREAGLWEEFQRIARYDEQDFRVYNCRGELEILQLTKPEDFEVDRSRPETDRPQIRAVLLGGLPEGTVRWERALQKIVQPDPVAPVSLRFRNGVVEEFDLVIGADGTWSRVRPLLSSTTPQYTGVTFFEMLHSNAAAVDPANVALVGKGNMFALGERRAINGHLTASGGVHVYAATMAEEPPARDALVRRDDVLALFSGWSPGLLRLLETAEPVAIPRPLWALPVGHSWEHRAGVTLLGDAAHVMSPFSGEGANLAMRDGADLAHAILRGLQQGADLDQQLRMYEADIQARAAVAAEGAMRGLEEAFSEDAIEHIREMFQAH